MKPRNGILIEDVIAKLASYLFALLLMGLFVYLIFTQPWFLKLIAFANTAVVTVILTLMFMEGLKLLRNKQL